MKRLIVCCDGTWNDLEMPYPTNVAKMAIAVTPSDADGVPQVVCYDEGVGTGKGLDRVSGGAFGKGIDKNIEEAYKFLTVNYEPGDEIYLFGFSRGSYTVRSLAGMIGKGDHSHKFRIGDGNSIPANGYRSPKAGRLYACANDVSSKWDIIDKYDNNQGWVIVDVERVG